MPLMKLSACETLRAGSRVQCAPLLKQVMVSVRKTDCAALETRGVKLASRAVVLLDDELAPRIFLSSSRVAAASR